MKNMKKIVVLMVAVMALFACSNQSAVESTEKATESETLDTASLVQRVNDIYTVVFDRYKAARTMLKPLRQGNFDAEYCSTDWNEWLQRVIDYDKANSQGMVGFFDADYWIMGQDWDDLSVSDVGVKTITDSTAVVVLKLHNCGSVTDVCLEMVQDGDTWKIDNFIDITNHVDWKANMKTYLKQSNKKQ